jgi:hypothetical protein
MCLGHFDFRATTRQRNSNAIRPWDVTCFWLSGEFRSPRAGNSSRARRVIRRDQAAQELLEEAIAESIAEMNRRMDLGLEAASEAICVGIVSGLFRASSESPCRLLEWAPDFPVEHACFVVEECVRRYHAAKRRVAADRLITSLSGVVPEWSEMISKVARRAARG